MEEQLNFYEAKLAFEIDSADLQLALKNNEDIIPVDTRGAQDYANGHIPGAVNLPHRSISEETISHLCKETTYVCYCDGIGCNASTKAARKLTALGFKVKELQGGMKWWKAEGNAVQVEMKSQAV